MMIPRTTAIIVAAGRSERFGGGDKVLLPLAGRPVLAHVLDAVEHAELVHDIVIVAGTRLRGAIGALLATDHWSKRCQLVAGGTRRQDSVLAGLNALPESAGTVAILDGARPLTTGELIDRCVAAAADGSAIAAIPVTDTLKRVDADGTIVNTVSRDGLWAAQTPQVFPVARLREGFRRVEVGHVTYTDEASLFESLGWPVKIVPADAANIKITWPDDLDRAERLMVPAAALASGNA